MILAKPTMVDLLTLASRARPDEIVQWEAVTGTRWDISEIAADHYARTGIKYVLVDPATDRPIVAGGYQLVGPDVWQSWMIGTMDEWGTHWRSITKATRRVMDELIAQGARRLQTTALASRTEAIHWYVKGLKMQPEGVMRNFGANGEDVAMFARTVARV